VRFHFDPSKSERLRKDPKRGIGFEEAHAIFDQPYGQNRVSEMPEQYRVVGWVGQRLYTLIIEPREDDDGEFYHLVTLWKATREEQILYEEHT
jgi:uncharacterized DUF497 family protein